MLFIAIAFLIVGAVQLNRGSRQLALSAIETEADLKTALERSASKSMRMGRVLIAVAAIMLIGLAYMFFTLSY